jgi:hypothetical protein
MQVYSHFHGQRALPNPSFEARPNGKPPGPPRVVAYPTHVGPGAFPSVPRKRLVMPS